MAMQKRIGVALAAAALVLAAHGCGKQGPTPDKKGPTFSTPEEAFAAFKQAAAKDDYVGLAGPLTDDTRRVLAGSLAAEATRLRIIVVTFLPKDSPVFNAAERAKMKAEWLSKVEPLDRLLGKYDVEEEAVTKAFAEAKGGGKEADRRALIKIAAPIRTPAVFLGDAVAALKQAGGKENTDKLAALTTGDLKDVTTNGDTATGTLVIQEGGAEKRMPLTFRRVDGSWRIDLVEPFLKDKR
jgi:hypothetical protein